MIATNKEAINNNSNKNRIRKKINAGNERLRNVNTQYIFSSVAVHSTVLSKLYDVVHC